MDHESATCLCPRCKRPFRVLAYEYGDHPCPYCGWEPWDFQDEDEDEEEGGYE